VLCTGGLCSPSRITRKKSDDRCGTRPRWLRRVSRLRSSTLAPASRRHLYMRAAPQSTPAGAGADGDRTARSRRNTHAAHYPAEDWWLLPAPRTRMAPDGRDRHSDGLVQELRRRRQDRESRATPGGLSEDLAPTSHASKLRCRRRRARTSRATTGGGRWHGPVELAGTPITTHRHAVPVGRVRERVIPVSGHAVRQPALPGASSELRAAMDAGLPGGRYLIPRPGVDGN